MIPDALTGLGILAALGGLVALVWWHLSRGVVELLDEALPATDSAPRDALVTTPAPKSIEDIHRIYEQMAHDDPKRAGKLKYEAQLQFHR